MNWDIIQGKWRELQGEARKNWGKITDNDWEQIAGNRDMLAGKLQARYGWARNDAEKKIDDFFRPLTSAGETPNT